jgi:DNA (cytosine-5)-methyltransferase 1
MENVSGMVKGKMKLIFAECLRELKASGYKVKARLLNAMYFNVPQSRKRVIIVGVREDSNREPGFPKARSRPPTVREAIGHLPIGKQGNHQPQVIGAWHKSKPGQLLRKAARFVGSFHSCRLDPNRPSMTQIKSHRHWHYATPRQLTDAETGLLASFPETYQWYGTKTQQQTGNSVPPNFMRAIAEYIRDEILL